MIMVTAADIQNNFGKYLNSVQSGEEIIILKNGKEIARLISHDKSVSFLADSLIGVLHENYDDKEMRNKRMKRYEGVD